MVYRGFLIWVVMFLGAAQYAQAQLKPQSQPNSLAQTKCFMTDAVLDSLSIVQDIQAAQSERQYFQHINDLDIRAAQLSLSALIPPDTKEAFPIESAALSHYITSLRGAVESARSGDDIKARQILMAARPAEFSRSLSSLEYYWGCRTDEGEAIIDAEAREGAAFYSAAPDNAVTSPNNDLAKAVLGTSNAGKTLSSSAPLYGRKSAREAVLIYPAPIGFAIICLALMGGTYYLRRRTQKYKYREARRYLYTPITLEINQTIKSVIMVDISMNGTKLRHSGTLKDRQTLKIKLNGEWHSGTAMWSNDLYAGIKFKKPLARSTFNTLVKSAMSNHAAISDEVGRVAPTL